MKKVVEKNLLLILRQNRALYVLFIGLLPILMILSCQTLKPVNDRSYMIRVLQLSEKDAYEDHRVRLGDEFFIADTEYSVKVIRLVPDFVIDKKTKEVSSRSNEMRNPALLLEVMYQGKLLYETWVLYQNPLPHKVPDPGYYFQFLSFETGVQSRE